MDIGAAIRYPFNDSRWLSKFVVGAVILLIPIIGMIVLLGYMVSIIQEVASGNEKQLPDWSDFGDHAGRGFISAITFMIFLIPVLIPACCLSGLSPDGNQDSSILSGIVTLVYCCGLLILLVYGLLVSMIFQTSLMRYAATDNVSSLFEIGTNVSVLRQHFTTAVPTLIITAIAPNVFTLLSLPLLCTICLPLFVLVYIFIFVGHLLGRLSTRLDLGYRPSVDTDFW